jgi:hypothetical protein
MPASIAIAALLSVTAVAGTADAREQAQRPINAEKYRSDRPKSERTMERRKDEQRYPEVLRSRHLARTFALL